METTEHELSGSTGVGLEAGFTGADLAEVERLLRSSIGLEPASVGVGWTRLRVRERMESVGLSDLTAYLDLLRSSPAELGTLAERVVVPETWFFRDGAPFSFLTRYVVDSWAPAHADLSLRVLSLACASGEEPYSIVMALLDVGFPPDRFHVDAVDLRRDALEQAQRGVYAAYSFRGQVGGFRARYFAESCERWYLDPRVKAPVRFLRANVLDAAFTRTLLPYDVVFCRNLMIYLSPEAREELRSVLSRLTAPGGFLVSGKAETLSAWAPDFAAARPVASCAYLRVGEATPRCSAPVVQVGGASAGVPSWNGAGAPSGPPREPAHGTGSAGAEHRLELARGLADQGELEAAERECSRLHAEHGPSSAVFVLLAAVASARGESDRVESLLGRALYLDPQNTDALALLAAARRRRGDRDGERLVRERLRRVMAAQTGSGR